MYRELKDPDKEARLEEERIMSRIDYWHTKMPYMGSRRIKDKLREEGFPVGRKLVRRLKRDMGIQAVYPKANLSKRNFKSQVQNCV